MKIVSMAWWLAEVRQVSCGLSHCCPMQEEDNCEFSRQHVYDSFSSFTAIFFANKRRLETSKNGGVKNSSYFPFIKALIKWSGRRRQNQPFWDSRNEPQVCSCPRSRCLICFFKGWFLERAVNFCGILPWPCFSQSSLVNAMKITACISWIWGREWTSFSKTVINCWFWPVWWLLVWLAPGDYYYFD